MSESSTQKTLLIILWRNGPNESGQFQVFPEVVLHSLLSDLRSFPAGWKVSILRGTPPKSSTNLVYKGIKNILKRIIKRNTHNVILIGIKNNNLVMNLNRVLKRRNRYV